MSERSLSDIFSADGPLASLSEGYRVRPSQVELARAVEQTIESGGTLVAEAGTGTFLRADGAASHRIVIGDNDKGQFE